MSAPPPQGPHGPNQGPHGPQQPGPYPGRPQGGPPQPPPGYGQQPPPPGGRGASGSRRGLIVGGVAGGAAVLLIAAVGVAVLSGSTTYGTLAEDRCEDILFEEDFSSFGGGASVNIDGEYEENGGIADSHVLECSVSYGSAENYEHAVQVLVEIHEAGSTGFEEAAGDMSDEVRDLESELEPGELGRPSGSSDLVDTTGDAMWEHSSLGDEGVVMAMPSAGEYMPDMAAAFFREENAFFGIFAGQPASDDFDPETGIADLEALGGQVHSSVQDVNESP